MKNIKKVVLSVLFAGFVMSSGTIKTSGITKTDCWREVAIVAGTVVGSVAIVVGALTIGLGGVTSLAGGIKYHIALGGKASKKEAIACHASEYHDEDSHFGPDYVKNKFREAEEFKIKGYALTGVGLLTIGAGITAKICLPRIVKSDFGDI